MSKDNLESARRTKNDEFYTRFEDIQEELGAYTEYDDDAFRGKAVCCNCDDPYRSNFFRYFVLNFNKLGLKQLIITSHNPSTATKSHKFIINKVQGIIDGLSLMDVVRQLRADEHNEWTSLEGDGDFRTEECIDLLSQADVVVTNPPFSLFREYVAQLVDCGKKFIVVGNMNAITYKDIFPLIRDGKLWLGAARRRSNLVFDVPGNRTSSIRAYWFTNIKHNRHPKPLSLMTMAENVEYDKYDNYDAIEIPRVADIPSDYNGIMGVPVSFLCKHNPSQFEILGSTEGVDQDVGGVYGRSSYVNGKKTFKRLFIRHRN